MKKELATVGWISLALFFFLPGPVARGIIGVGVFLWLCVKLGDVVAWFERKPWRDSRRDH